MRWNVEQLMAVFGVEEGLLSPHPVSGYEGLLYSLYIYSHLLLLHRYLLLKKLLLLCYLSTPLTHL